MTRSLILPHVGGRGGRAAADDLHLEAVAFAIVAILDGGAAVGAHPLDEPPLRVIGQLRARLAAAGADRSIGRGATGHVAAGIVLCPTGGCGQTWA